MTAKERDMRVAVGGGLVTAKERDMRVAVVHGCFSEGGDSILSALISL